MAKLTLAFKDRKLKVIALSAGDCIVGRDPDCTLVIDSLAVEPRHLRIQGTDDSFSVDAIDASANIRINDQPLTGQHSLQEGDRIQLGKHSLSYSSEPDSRSSEAPVVTLPVVGWLQIQRGSHLGRTIRLDKAFTRVGRENEELAVIARRDDGYYLSLLQGEQGPSINDEPIGDQSCKLQAGDNISVGELQFQFFADGAGAETRTADDAPSRQRRFSRIPFDVNATLADDNDSWETDLLDISLHGALVQMPPAFRSRPEATYRLAVHLKGGPDIRMDVEIAHQEDRQLGLNCRDIDVKSVTHLRRLVELNLGEPDLLERELAALGH